MTVYERLRVDQLFRIPRSRPRGLRRDPGTGPAPFVSIGLGQVEVDGENCFLVSLASPIGQALKDKQVGEQVNFNGRMIAVKSIA